MQGITAKIVIVTGASSGIGVATAKQLVEGGARVMLAARREERLRALAEELGDKCAYCVTDVADRDSVLALAAATLEAFGRIDVLVNNAGIMPLSMLASRKVEEWDRMVDVNIKGVLYGIDAVLSHMLERGDGQIVNVSSLAGHRVAPGGAVYSGTKYAVRAISEGLRQETAGKIRVNIISPGAVTTELANSITDQAMLTGLREKFNFQFLEAADIARAVLYAIAEPENVSLSEILVRPSQQSF